MKFFAHNWSRSAHALIYFTLMLFWFNACGQNSSTAELFINDIYRGYQLPNPPNYLGAAADTIFTEDMLKLIRKDLEIADESVGILNYDPICDCQDFGISDIKIKITNKEKTKLAHVAFNNLGTYVEVQLTLVEVGSKWKISDIHSKTVPSLYQLLKTHVDLNPKNK